MWLDRGGALPRKGSSTASRSHNRHPEGIEPINIPIPCLQCCPVMILIIGGREKKRICGACLSTSALLGVAKNAIQRERERVQLAR